MPTCEFEAFLIGRIGYRKAVIVRSGPGQLDALLRINARQTKVRTEPKPIWTTASVSIARTASR